MRRSTNREKLHKKMSDPSFPHIYMWTPGVYDGSRHFVFFDSLTDEELTIFHNQWMHAYNYFATPLGRNPFDKNKTMQKLENSLDFLYNAMLIERNKEMAYVNSFLSRNGMASIGTPSSIEGWARFFNAIQEVKTNAGDFLDKLREEKERIERNREYIKGIENNKGSMSTQEYERARRGYDHGANSELARATERRINTIITGTMNKGNFATDVCDYITSRYSQQLFDYAYSGKDIRPVLAGIQVMVDQLIYVQLNKTLTGKNGIFSDKATKAERMETLDRLLRENPLGAQLDALLSSQDRMDSLEAAVRTSMGLKVNQNKRQDRKKLSSVASLIEKAELTRRGKKDREYVVDKIPRPSNGFCEIKIQRGQMSEIETAVNSIVISALDKGVQAHATYGSGRNAFQATDVMELVLIAKDGGVSECAQSMIEDFNKLNQDAANRFKNIGANGRTAKNAREMTKMYEEYYAELVKKMGQYKKLYDDAAELFHVEISNKDYEAMGLNGTNEFKGAALGSNAEDVAERILMMTEGGDKISKYQETGGLSVFDVNWLSNAILNSGEHMVGNQFKGTVINYLQMFAAFLMFDDFGVMAQEYIDTMAHNAQNSMSDMGIHTIHLYKLQTFYMPSSYILEQVYIHMKKSLQNIFQEVTNVGHGVKVSITGNNYEYKKPRVIRSPEADENGYHALLNPEEAALTEEKWEAEAEKAMKNTKIEMTFMGSFLDFINEFLNPANSK